MKNLFDPTTAAEVKMRISRLQPDCQRQWGTMDAAQAAAHLAIAMEMALGDRPSPPMFIGRLVGPLVRWLVVRDDKPIRRNSPTMPVLTIADPRDLANERGRLLALVERFSDGGAAVCTRRPHGFFGRMTPEDWAVLMYKHIDHHLRQFSV